MGGIRMRQREIITIAFVAALTMLASCTKNNGPGVNSIKAGMPSMLSSGSKTYLRVNGSRGETFWSVNDEIRIFQSGTGYDYRLTNGMDTKIGVFSGEHSLSGDIVAFYPASLNPTISGNTISVSVPRTQTYTKNTFAKDAALMVAKGNISNSLQFQNLCGVLCVELKGTEKVTRITVSSETKILSGAGTVNMGPDRPTLSMSALGARQVVLDCSGEPGGGVTLSNDTATSFYIVVPPYTDASAFEVDVLFDSKKEFIKSSKATINIPQNTIKYMPELTAVGTCYYFSVSPTKKVKFAHGNLVYNAGNVAGRWGFHKNQWDLSHAKTSASVEDKGTWCAVRGGYYSTGNTNPGKEIDLFGWATSGNAPAGGVARKPWYNDYTSTYYGPAITSGEFDAAYDWATCVNAQGDLGVGWHTLSGEEWRYLIYRSNASKGWVTLTLDDGNIVTGFIFMPDGYTVPLDSVFTENDSHRITLEKAGALFLPVAGHRNGTTLQDLEQLGSYWSSTASTEGIPEHAQSLHINWGADQKGHTGVEAAWRSHGRNVRLAVEL